VFGDYGVTNHGTGWRKAIKSSPFISETPVGVHEKTPMKEHLVRHGSKQNTSAYNKKKQTAIKTKSYAFPKQKQRETRENIINQNKS